MRFRDEFALIKNDLEYIERSQIEAARYVRDMEFLFDYRRCDEIEFKINDANEPWDNAIFHCYQYRWTLSGYNSQVPEHTRERKDLVKPIQVLRFDPNSGQIIAFRTKDQGTDWSTIDTFFFRPYTVTGDLIGEVVYKAKLAEHTYPVHIGFNGSKEEDHFVQVIGFHLLRYDMKITGITQI